MPHGGPRMAAGKVSPAEKHAFIIMGFISFVSACVCECLVLPPQSPAFTDIEAGGASAQGREVLHPVPAAAASTSASSRIGRSLLIWLQLRYAAVFAWRQKGHAATNGGRPAAPDGAAAAAASGGGGGAGRGGAGGTALLFERHSSSSDVPSESGDADIDVEAGGVRGGVGCCGGGAALCATLGAELQMEGELKRLTAGMLLSLCDTGMDIAVVTVGVSRGRRFGGAFTRYNLSSGNTDLLAGHTSDLLSFHPSKCRWAFPSNHHLNQDSNPGLNRLPSSYRPPSLQMLWAAGLTAPAALATAFVCLPLPASASALASVLWRVHHGQTRSLALWHHWCSAVSGGSGGGGAGRHRGSGSGAGGGSGSLDPSEAGSAATMPPKGGRAATAATAVAVAGPPPPSAAGLGTSPSRLPKVAEEPASFSFKGRDESGSVRGGAGEGGGGGGTDGILSRARMALAYVLAGLLLPTLLLPLAVAGLLLGVLLLDFGSIVAAVWLHTLSARGNLSQG